MPLAFGVVARQGACSARMNLSNWGTVNLAKPNLGVPKPSMTPAMPATLSKPNSTKASSGPGSNAAPRLRCLRTMAELGPDAQKASDVADAGIRRALAVIRRHFGNSKDRESLGFGAWSSSDAGFGMLMFCRLNDTLGAMLRRRARRRPRARLRPDLQPGDREAQPVRHQGHIDGVVC